MLLNDHDTIWSEYKYEHILTTRCTACVRAMTRSPSERCGEAFPGIDAGEQGACVAVR